MANRESLTCPHCRLAVSVVFEGTTIVRANGDPGTDGHFNGYVAGCPACHNSVARFQRVKPNGREDSTFVVWPRSPGGRLLPPSEVPEEYRKLFLEAASVVELSPMASAALSRRCLQQLIRDHYKIQKRNLDDEVKEVLAQNLLPGDLATHLDAVRSIGNFAAHPMKSTNAGEIIEVEPHEADWTLEVLEELFDHAFVRPARTAARKLAFDAKLAEAKKPPLK